MTLYQKIKLYLVLKILDWRYYHAVKNAQKYGNDKNRVFIVINPNDKLVIINRKSMRWFRSRKVFERNFKMRELRKQSVYYYPAYPDDKEHYEKMMAIKKELYMKQMMKTTQRID